MTFLDATLATLKTARDYVVEKTGRSQAVVFYSGGKDARVVLDLAVRTFDRVVPVGLYFLPGLQCWQEQIGDAKTRYGLDVLEYPHWSVCRSMATHPPIYRFPLAPEDRAIIPDWKLRDVYDLAIGETGIPLILDGAKASDGLWRRRVLKAVVYEQVYHPIEKWLKVHVLDYLNAHNIPIPNMFGQKVASGIGVNEPFIRWLHENRDRYPGDWEKVCNVFPLAPAVVWRRKFFGV